MNVALVGNNDGPLVLLKSMMKSHLTPVCIGLQKKPSETLKPKYLDLVSDAHFFSGFEEKRLIDYLNGYNIDVLVNCFCNFKFNKLLNKYQVLNVHLAPLPKYRGRHPLHWALINGETQFGFTIHKMNADFDAGTILFQKSVPVENGMSVAALREALMKKLHTYFGDFILSYIHSEIPQYANKNTEATYAPRRYPKDSALNEWHDASIIFRKVMALRSEKNPAYLPINGQKIPVSQAKIISKKIEINKLAGTNFRALPAINENALVYVDKVDANGIEIRCLDGQHVGLYGFDPSAANIIKNQRIV